MLPLYTNPSFLLYLPPQAILLVPVWPRLNLSLRRQNHFLRERYLIFWGRIFCSILTMLVFEVVTTKLLHSISEALYGTTVYSVRVLSLADKLRNKVWERRRTLNKPIELSVRMTRVQETSYRLSWSVNWKISGRGKGGRMYSPLLSTMRPCFSLQSLVGRSTFYMVRLVGYTVSPRRLRSTLTIYKEYIASSRTRTIVPTGIAIGLTTISDEWRWSG